MRAITKILCTVALMAASCFGASAQYYQLANQATNMLSTILNGGANYRGYLDVSYLAGIGDKKADFVEFSTTHGIKRGIFFMGIGLGVDLMHGNTSESPFVPSNHDYTHNAVMIPMFTDFKLNFGSENSSGVFVDLKIGAGFYVANKYILVGDGYVNSGESFLLKPTIGMRVPLSASNPKLAMNIGASYQLLTNSYWYNPGKSNSITLSSLGVNVNFEW